MLWFQEEAEKAAQTISLEGKKGWQSSKQAVIYCIDDGTTWKSMPYSVAVQRIYKGLHSLKY